MMAPSTDPWLCDEVLVWDGDGINGMEVDLAPAAWSQDPMEVEPFATPHPDTERHQATPHPSIKGHTAPRPGAGVEQCIDQEKSAEWACMSKRKPLLLHGLAVKKKADASRVVAPVKPKPRVIGSGAFCKVFDMGGGLAKKLMLANPGEGLCPAQLRELNVYGRLESVPTQFLDTRLLSVQSLPDRDLAYAVTVQMPLLAGDMWNQGRSAWWSLGTIQTLLPVMVDDITVALHRLHRSGLLHRDVKPLNVLTDHAHFFLIDFGSSNFEAVPTRTGNNCTYVYCAPEAGPNVKHGKDSVMTDVYSFGATVLSVLLRQFPIQEDLYDWSHEVTQHRTSFPAFAAPWIDVLHQCVAKKPDQRPTLQAVRQAFGLPEFTGEQDQPLPFKVWPKCEMRTIDALMQDKIPHWNNCKFIVIDWMRELAVENEWSRLTFATAVQLFFDSCVHARLAVQKHELQALAVVALSLAHRCLEDVSEDVSTMTWYTDNTYSEQYIFALEKRVWAAMDYVVTRRPVRQHLPVDFPELVKFACENGL